MDEELLEIVRAEKARIADMGASNAYQWTSAEHVYELGKQLEQFEPFKHLAKRWLRLPLGAGRTGSQLAGRWAWLRLLGNMEPEAIIAFANESIISNRYEVLEVRAIKGITVAEPQHLSDTISLVPNQSLPNSSWHQQAFAHPMSGQMFPTETAALVVRVKIEPALVLAHDEHLAEADARERGNRDAYAARLRLALGLASGGPVEMPSIYASIDEASIYGSGGGGYQQTPTMTYFGNDRPVDIPITLRLVDQLANMKTPRALELSIDRLLRSRLSRSLEDRIIDLGMAAEIVLMHMRNGGGGDGKGEITNKISSRAAWLVGEEPEERARIFKLIGDLYSARSVVVHTGTANAALQTRIEEFDAIIVRIARALLDRGEFPDWKALVLGG